MRAKLSRFRGRLPGRAVALSAPDMRVHVLRREGGVLAVRVSNLLCPEFELEFDLEVAAEDGSAGATEDGGG